jgi:hypothetical protein
MTPKEKAKKLVERFIFEHSDEPAIAYFIVKRAKECAFIVVNEVTDQNNIWIEKTGKGSNNYWNEVWKEIVEL